MRTSSGAVRGRETGGVASFKGVPFARPPFGEHRMRAPAPAEPWDGVREADAFGPRPPQHEGGPGMRPWSSGEGLDCLTVNVWTPDPGGSGLPVMVWIYGGAYISGWSGMPEYDGTRLAAAGVVVVSFDHRVGMEGFGQVPGVPANRGLLDQVAALRWVRENIAAFGGDPDLVTVFGESAGAGGVASLMVMPSARGLFRRAIAQSVPGTFFSAEYAGRVGAAITALLPGGNPLEAAPEAVIEAASAFMTKVMPGDVETWGPIALTPTCFSPVVDGEVLPVTPWEGLARGDAAGVELVAGFNRDEYALFTAMDPTLDLDARLPVALAALAPDGAAELYRGDARAAYTALMSDWLFRMPSALLADAHRGTTYAYELTWSPSPLGACHALDLPLTFGVLDGDFARMLTGGSPDAANLSEQFRAAWTAFARTGDPGWPRHDADTAVTHLFDVTPSDVPDPEAASRALWGPRGFPPVD
ncbi:carboxylesterase/lipase family protein [Bailinhaonella thermotolerans]|uniref:Carboxylic ester hydrolase n=1 Tax=Bailinhaonella thermotolerans TaxID=1070861 RepID=A0A3A4B0F7_9ACTN|nr:carboxylesterase/lipase family protein [Bailinhaonella thermotolerans]